MSLKIKTWLEKRKITIELLHKLADELESLQSLSETASGMIMAGACLSLMAAPFTAGISTLCSLGVAGFGFLNGVQSLMKNHVIADLTKEMQRAFDDDRNESNKLNIAIQDMTYGTSEALNAEHVTKPDMDIISVHMHNEFGGKSVGELRKMADQLEGERKKIESTFESTWTKLQHYAVHGSAAECYSLIESSPKDVDIEVDSAFHPYPDLHLPKKVNMTPLQLAMYSGDKSAMEILARHFSFTSIEQCLAGSSDTVIRDILVRGILYQLRQNHEDVQYGNLIQTGENVIVIHTNNDKHNDTFPKTAGITTIWKDTKRCDQDNEKSIDYELNMMTSGLSQEENDRMRNVVRAYSDSLWKNHENLNGIHLSAVRTTNGTATAENCIVLFCKFKGFLSGEEEPFPKSLRCAEVCFPVDVRENQTVRSANSPSDRLEPLACGGRIQGSCKANNVYGTIGPFVKLSDQEKGFITCAHVIDNNPSFGVVKNHNHLVYQPEKDDLCGEVVKMAFKPSSYPSMDAAVVKITPEVRIPQSIDFVSCNQEALMSEGLATLTINTGAIGLPLPDSTVFKFGAFTPVLKCKCSAIGHEEYIRYPQGMVLMKGLTKILCHVNHQYGDSGAGVYVNNANDKLECIGLFIAGRGREGYFIPIQDVLHQCGNYNLM
ncbi:uncharacterized protein LOC117315266 [Pecten maximus]|uniref:uncharacterized protein LOC117315266 n=1 Tax=Pecten maximus TaxID=6579 RepID=UPI0014591340|nr:uncharacterized protein LOC117315266 [Pecten maximus]